MEALLEEAQGGSMETELPRLSGGRLCLDFANTVGPRVDVEGEQAHDFLGGYAHLVQWAGHAGILGAEDASRLLAAAARAPAAAQSTFEAAIGLREAIYRSFSAIAHGAAPDPADLGGMQRAYAEAMAHARIRPQGSGLAWAWAGGDDLGRVWWPVARSAVELAVAGPLQRVKQCPLPDGCAWLFLDSTKNGSRRWCSMEECGGQAKARRQSARRRAARRGRVVAG
jgi:predicted RNA-binding Zn ribbon-like protein